MQRRACTYHITPAGPPDPVHNCTVFNQTFTALQISCGSGFDGGLRQLFRLEVRDAKTGNGLLTLEAGQPEWLVPGLAPGHGYVVTVWAANSKGVSEPLTLHAFTLRETRPELIVADTSRQGQGQGEVVVTPVLVILIAILAGLALVAVCIILVMRVKHSKAVTSLHTTHIAMDKTGDCDGQRSTSSGHIQNPDIIPSNKGVQCQCRIILTEIVPSLDLFPELIEEEEAFEIFREQQFATIARRHKDGGGGDHPGGSSRGFRNNLSRLVNADKMYFNLQQKLFVPV